MIKPHITIEVCANSLTSALAAQAGGAGRIELCENLFAGGTTPGFGTLALARELLKIPIHVLIRPRPGDFLYNDMEFATMKMDIQVCKELGMNGIVIGLLTTDGQVDKEKCRELIETARPMSVTFHRAFDMCADPFKALEDIIGLGFDRLLTAGQECQALHGIQLIHDLVQQAAGRIRIMPGSGINEENVLNIIEATGVTEVHMTAGIWSDSLMKYKHPRCRLSDKPGEDFTTYATNIERLHAIRKLTDRQ